MVRWRKKDRGGVVSRVLAGRCVGVGRRVLPGRCGSIGAGVLDDEKY